MSMIGPTIKKAIAGGVIVASLSLGYWASRAFYTVTKVFDGDTFLTSENQYIRLDSVDAPELDSCLGKESKEQLENLVLGKKVYLKVSYINGMRLVASVYTSKGNVGQKMLEKGLAVFEDKGHQDQGGLLKVAQEARLKRVGVYSSTCTQSSNPLNEKCSIKGNIRGSTKSYRYPECDQYKNTLVQLHFGDRWFCTQSEAKRAGFEKASDCN